ncbi:GNAT family N-acetyltransferase [Tahibacter harae]|uniref:GNAT family N-acetyltransferase n=1 Tax=Tahibacter harae TaxID=2963937 RepID=A0ABT1QTV4_9GAMM|nr:GNAT family N-acetyltransferase [Tahibacter harae]MCQ4165708.1 GNAT family N-acetyltransferase [Tahibacter harae]
MHDLLCAVPVLESPRLQLRSIDRGDLDRIYALHSDPRAMRYWSFPAWTAPQQARDWFLRQQHFCAQEEVWPWAVVRREDDRLIGLFTLFAVNRLQRRAELGYLLDSAHWGRGYAQEAARLVLAYAFDALELARVEADIDPRNSASCRLVERLGFQREGLLRERWHVAGEIADTAFYGLLAREFLRG